MWHWLKERRTGRLTWQVSTSRGWQACECRACNRCLGCSRWAWEATSCRRPWLHHQQPAQRFFAPGGLRAPQPRWPQQNMAAPYGASQGMGMIGMPMNMMPGMTMARGGARSLGPRMVQQQQQGVGMERHAISMMGRQGSQGGQQYKYTQVLNLEGDSC